MDLSHKAPSRRTGVTLVLLLGLAGSGCDDRRDEPYDRDFDIPRTETFAPSLSAYSLYAEPAAALQPSSSTLVYELSSELFTDYAFKQRLVKVPNGTTITLADDATLAFPEGTVLAKTFFYRDDMRDEASPRRLIETRLLVKTAGTWNVATYLWNEEQTDATLLLTGTTTQVSWLDDVGQIRAADYAVPHEGECVTCHQLDGSSVFIGPTVASLNRTVTRNGTELNQLEHLVASGVLNGGDWATAPSLPDYRDATEPLDRRARAYLDINCAHCHSPGRWDESSEINLDLRFDMSLSESGIVNKAEDMRKQLDNGEMPFLGTTIKHDDGIRLVLDYLETL